MTEYSDLEDGDKFEEVYYVYSLSEDKTHYQFQTATTDSMLVGALRIRLSTLIFQENLGERINEDGTPWVALAGCDLGGDSEAEQ